MAGSPPSSDDEDDEVGEEEEQPLSTAGSNKTFLNSRLTFQLDANGQEICVDAEGNGVMMGWEREIMNRTAELLCHTRSAVDGELWVLNVGFGLGIVRHSPAAIYRVFESNLTLLHPRSIQPFRRILLQIMSLSKRIQT